MPALVIFKPRFCHRLQSFLQASATFEISKLFITPVQTIRYFRTHESFLLLPHFPESANSSEPSQWTASAVVKAWAQTSPSYPWRTNKNCSNSWSTRARRQISSRVCLREFFYYPQVVTNYLPKQPCPIFASIPKLLSSASQLISLYYSCPPPHRHMLDEMRHAGHLVRQA
jgi:hypothetical protein